jgi:hypothetical protein
MELRASGMILDEKVKIKKFNGDDCLVMDFTCDTTRIKIRFFKNSSWIIYLDPENYKIKGWEVDGLSGLKGIAVYTGNFVINGINIPMVKTYYSTIDKSFLAIDLFSNTK